jgi:uroporphyrinogen decarboxylase
MNSLERVIAAVNFQPTDRVPVMAQVFGHAAVLAGVKLGAYLRDGALLARCQLHALAYYDYDAVFALMDVGVESEALGSTLTYHADQYPSVQSYRLAGAAKLDTLAVPDPQRAGRMPEVLKAARILRQSVGRDVPVVGCVMGPMTLATQLLGIETALYLAIDHPEQFADLLDFAAEVGIRFGLAQLEAGAHLPIVFEPSASPEVIPPAFYREFVLPRLTRVFTAFKQAGSPAMQILPQTCLDGNLKPLLFVAGTPAEVAAESRRLIHLFANRGGFILSSGCEIPPESQPENIAALVHATRQPG